LLPSFVSEAHAHVRIIPIPRAHILITELMSCQGVEAHIAIGGWGGSIYFSSNVATAENRTAFVRTVVNFVRQYNLDGVNFEYVCQPAITRTYLTNL